MKDFITSRAKGKKKLHTGTFVSMVNFSLIQGDINTDIMGLSGTDKKTISITSPKADSRYALFYTDIRGTANVCRIMITSKEASLPLFISSCVQVFKSPCNREKECVCAHISVLFFFFLAQALD